MSKKSPSPWLILLALCLYTFAISLTNTSIPPIISILVKELGITYADAGLLTTIFCLPGIFLIIPLSFLSYRFKLKNMGIISLLFILIGNVLVAATGHYIAMLAGRLLGGIGWALLPVVGLQGVAKWFIGPRLGLAMGIYNLFVFIAMITALNTFGEIGIIWGWRTVIWITTAVIALATVIFAILFKEPESKAEKFSLPAATLFKLGWPVWLIGISWGLFSFGIAAIFTFLPDMLYEKGFSLGIAGSTTSIIIICTAILSPFTGYILDKTRHKQIFVVIGAAISSIFVFLLPANINYIIGILIIIGITTAPFVTVFMSVVPSLVKAEWIGLAFGLITMVNTVGSFVGPYVFGYIRDFTGSYEFGYSMVSVLFLVIATLIGVSIFKENRNNRIGQGTTE